MMTTIIHHEQRVARVPSQNLRASTSFLASSKTRLPGQHTQNVNSNARVVQNRSVRPTKHIFVHDKPFSVPWRQANLSSCSKIGKAKTSMSHHLADMRHEEHMAIIHTADPMGEHMATPMYGICDQRSLTVDLMVTDTVSSFNLMVSK